MNETAKRFLLLDLSPKATWELLTVPRHLAAWFCDQAEVEPRPGGLFRFSGRCVFGGSVETRFARFEAPETLTFSWLMVDADTQINWTLEPHLSMTRLIVSHTATSTGKIAFTDSGATDTGCSEQLSLGDIWWNHWVRLRYYVETGKEPHKQDLSLPPGDRFKQTMMVDVPVEQAFAALTEGRHLDAWMGQNSNPSLKLGEKFDIGWRSGPQQVTAYAPNKIIAYKWTYTDEPETEVTWTVERDGAKARISLVHSGFGKAAKAFKEYNHGWGAFLVRLALYLEKGISTHGWTGESD